MSTFSLYAISLRILRRKINLDSPQIYTFIYFLTHNHIHIYIYIYILPILLVENWDENKYKGENKKHHDSETITL